MDDPIICISSSKQKAAKSQREVHHMISMYLYDVLVYGINQAF